MSLNNMTNGKIIYIRTQQKLVNFAGLCKVACKITFLQQGQFIMFQAVKLFLCVGLSVRQLISQSVCLYLRGT